MLDTFPYHHVCLIFMMQFICCQREAAFQFEKDGLVASLAEAKESLLRERATHSDLIQAKERAAAADRLALSEIHKDAEESFKCQRDVLNGHVAGATSPFCPCSLVSPPSSLPPHIHFFCR